MIERCLCDVYMNMNAVHTSSHTNETFSWTAEVKLAIVLSAIAALVASVLTGRVDESHIIVGTIVIASLLGWSRVQFAEQ